MDDSTRKFIAHLPIPQKVSVKRAAEILDDGDAAQELLGLVAHGHLFSWTHSPVSGDTNTRFNHSLGTHIEMPRVAADTDPAKVFIEGSEVQWRWCVRYEERFQGVERPEQSTVEAREKIVLEHARFEKYKRLRSAVRLDQSRVTVEIEHLQSLEPLSVTEAEMRPRMLAAMHAELCQIKKRLAALDSGMSVDAQHAAEASYTIEEMRASRPYHELPSADDAVRRAAEIRTTNEEIDAPIAVEQVTTIEATTSPTIKKEGYLLKRAALVAKYLSTWPDIESDLNHASENGLSTAAKGTKHGDWFESSALGWADQRGKRKVQQVTNATNSIFNVSGTQHTIK